MTDKPEPMFHRPVVVSNNLTICRMGGDITTTEYGVGDNGRRIPIKYCSTCGTDCADIPEHAKRTPV